MYKPTIIFYIEYDNTHESDNKKKKNAFKNI
jgi:hypothetical protein